jgi:hypothetical protein
MVDQVSRSEGAAVGKGSFTQMQARWSKHLLRETSKSTREAVSDILAGSTKN